MITEDGVNRREARLKPLLEIIKAHPDGISLPELKAALDPHLDLGDDAVKYRLKSLVNSGQVVMQGTRGWAKYLPVDSGAGETFLSKNSSELARYINKPMADRLASSYDGGLIESYEPNSNSYLTAEEQRDLDKTGANVGSEQPAGTYARRIIDRLLIDLSWNSSRLEGTTYSLLDTRRLIVFDEKAEGAAAIDAQMIDDVNKRVSRMAANIPFVKKSLIPISFVQVPEDAYSKALLGFYERGDASMMKDLFIWAYGKSAQHYASVRQLLGAPDPFRMKKTF